MEYFYVVGLILVFVMSVDLCINFIFIFRNIVDIIFEFDVIGMINFLY